MRTSEWALVPAANIQGHHIRSLTEPGMTSLSFIKWILGTSVGVLPHFPLRHPRLASVKRSALDDDNEMGVEGHSATSLRRSASTRRAMRRPSSGLWRHSAFATPPPSATTGNSAAGGPLFLCFLGVSPPAPVTVVITEPPYKPHNDLDKDAKRGWDSSNAKCELQSSTSLGISEKTLGSGARIWSTQAGARSAAVMGRKRARGKSRCAFNAPDCAFLLHRGDTAGVTSPAGTGPLSKLACCGWVLLVLRLLDTQYAPTVLTVAAIETLLGLTTPTLLPATYSDPVLPSAFPPSSASPPSPRGADCLGPPHDVLLAKLALPAVAHTVFTGHRDGRASTSSPERRDSLIDVDRQQALPNLLMSNTQISIVPSASASTSPNQTRRTTLRERCGFTLSLSFAPAVLDSDARRKRRSQVISIDLSALAKAPIDDNALRAGYFV
ncbi:hypothetical protein C8R46DRAFT_1342572 [Mycena filopes]|nr:hypothetical protein C8R46DRAFT_1342572 [Mycena filopes]